MQNTIDGLRAAITALQSELAQIENAGLSRAEIQRNLKSFAAAAVAAGDERIRHGVVSDDIASVFRLRVSSGLVDVAPMLAALLGAEGFGAALCKQLEHVPAGLDAAKRSERANEIRGELDRLERAEEAAIVAAEDAGVAIARRGNARPEIVLGLPAAEDEYDDGQRAPAKPATGLVPTAPMPGRPRTARSEYMNRKRE